MAGGLALLLAAAGAFAEEYLRVDSPSDGRSYTIDLDQTSVRRAMHPVAKSTGTSKLPAWLLPAPNAQPSDVRYDPGTGMVQAIFMLNALETDVIAFYTEALRGARLRTSSNPIPGGQGIYLSGSNDSIAVTIRVEHQQGQVPVHITYNPRMAPKSHHFEAAWYDDRTGILRLRDTSTGEEYEMTKRDVQENNLNRVGGVESSNSNMPPWLSVYPGARLSPPGRISWMFKPTAEYVTTASIRQVYDYYKAALEAVGASITSTNFMKSGTPARDFSARLIARREEDQVEIHIGEVVQVGGFPGAKNSGQQTGIGVRYTVPLR
jgi:hypothetical protein